MDRGKPADGVGDMTAKRILDGGVRGAIVGEASDTVVAVAPPVVAQPVDHQLAGKGWISAAQRVQKHGNAR